MEFPAPGVIAGRGKGAKGVCVVRAAFQPPTVYIARRQRRRRRRRRRRLWQW